MRHQKRFALWAAPVAGFLLSAGLSGEAVAQSCPGYDWTLEAGEGPTPAGNEAAQEPPEFDGEPAEYASAWAAKELCTRIFVAGEDPGPTIRNELHLASALAPGYVYELADVEVDREQRKVVVHHRGHPPRTSVHTPSQGCIILPAFSGKLHFEPEEIPWQGPSADEPWPRGENVWHGASEIDRDILEATLDAHMALPAVGTHEAGARSVAVVHKGELVGERYQEAYGKFTPQRSWSVNKSLTSTLVGMMVDRELLQLDCPVPIAAWRNDPRANITLRNLVNMASGLDQANTTGDPETTFMPANEHAFIYFDGFNTLKDAIENPAKDGVPPGTAFEYRNANVLIAAGLARAAAGSSGNPALDPDTLIQRQVFEPLGMRSSVQEHDPYGNYIGSGTWFTTARDMARLGLLYLNEGMYAGERLLSEEWVDFVQEPGASSEYGGFWWLQPGNDDFSEIPEDAYNASGAFGQFILVVPSCDLVIARIGANFPEDPVGMDQLFWGIQRAIEAGGGTCGNGSSD